MTHNTENQQIRVRVSSPLARVLSKRIAWFSIAMCLLLLATVIGVVAKNGSADAASAKHAVSAPKHAHAPNALKHVHVPHQPAHLSNPGRTMPTMSISPTSLSFTLSLAHPQMVTHALTITNNGARILCWQSIVTTPPGTTWVSVPTRGTVGPDTSVQVAFTVKPSKQMQVGTYTEQLELDGKDQHGVIVANSPQTIALSLDVTQ